MEFLARTPEYSYVPDGLKSLRLTEIHTHEYWGEAFARGECHFALFQRENGGHVAVCTFGDWYDLREGQTCVFRHDQHGRHTVLKFVRVLTRTEERGPKVPFWTLK